MTERKERAKQRLEKILRAVCEDIEQNGVASLWDDESYITGGKITIEISVDMIPAIHYEKTVFPKGMVKYTV